MAKTTKKIASNVVDNLEDEIRRVEGNAKADYDYLQDRGTRLADEMVDLKTRLNKLEAALSLGKAFLLAILGIVVIFCAAVGLQALIAS